MTKRTIYSLSGVTFFKKESNGRKKIGTLDVVTGSTISISPNTSKLEGGDSKFPWHVVTTSYNSEVQIKTKECPAWLLKDVIGYNSSDSNSFSLGNNHSSQTFGVLVTALHGDGGSPFVIECKKCVASGFPLNLGSEYTEIDFTINVLRTDNGDDPIVMHFLDDKAALKTKYPEIYKSTARSTGGSNA